MLLAFLLARLPLRDARCFRVVIDIDAAIYDDAAMFTCLLRARVCYGVKMRRCGDVTLVDLPRYATPSALE